MPKRRRTDDTLGGRDPRECFRCSAAHQEAMLAIIYSLDDRPRPDVFDCKCTCGDEDRLARSLARDRVHLESERRRVALEDKERLELEATAEGQACLKALRVAKEAEEAAKAAKDAVIDEYYESLIE